jgi:hypothetical protein
MRPSQLAGVSEALKLGIPYWLLIRWEIKGTRTWTCLELTALQKTINSVAWHTSLPYAATSWACMGSLRQCVEAITE